MLRVKNFFNFSPKPIFFWPLTKRVPPFSENSRRLTRSDWVSSETQIVQAFRMQFWKMALAEMLVVAFSMFSTNTNGRAGNIT